MRYLIQNYSALLVLSLLSLPVMATEARSGYHYLKPDTRAVQDDEFANPGLMAVENGEVLFNKQYKSSGKSCVDCHGVSGEKLRPRSLARYPLVDEDSK